MDFANQTFCPALDAGRRHQNHAIDAQINGKPTNRPMVNEQCWEESIIAIILTDVTAVMGRSTTTHIDRTYIMTGHVVPLLLVWLRQYQSST